MLACNSLFSIFGLPFVHDRDGMAYLAKPGGDDPTSREQAHLSNHEGWLESEKVEMANHESNLSWVEINASDKPTNRKIVKLVWVYKIKRNGKLKSRLCVQGCTQIAGIDYHQTFCAAMRSSTLRLLSSQLAWAMGYVAGILYRHISRESSSKAKSFTAPCPRGTRRSPVDRP